MAVIVVHAGMPKAGSSSVQQWLRREARQLQERGVTVLVAAAESPELAFVPFERGSVNSSWIVDRGVGRPAAEQQRGVDALVAALAAAAERYGDVVLSGESFAHPFWNHHSITLAGLQRLAGSHAVKVAYYVRPQHTSLEAAWRQWGYRAGTRPSVYVRARSAQLRYAATRRGVHELAPDVEFEPRPFRQDMLDGGDVVPDFARRFLGLDAEPAPPANPGLPLEVANVLSAAPPGAFWDRSYGNERIERIKQLLAGHTLPEEEGAALSRDVLRKFAHETFAAENRELGWDDFVPPPPDPDGTPGVEALDRLWRPQASPAELALLFRALQAAIER